VYVTARPRRVLEESRAWLEKCGYPAGPVLTSPGVTDNINIVELKQANIMKIKKDWPKCADCIGTRRATRLRMGDVICCPIIVRAATGGGPWQSFDLHAIVAGDREVF